MEADVTVFEVSPIADPCRGGRWASVQLWDKSGRLPRQVSELKIRLPDEGDVQPYIDDACGILLAWARGHDDVRDGEPLIVVGS